MNDFEKALQGWLERAQAMVNKYFVDAHLDNLTPSVLSIDPNGKKYIRIVSSSMPDQMGHTHRSVFCFIEKETGNVLKASGWKAPAKHARGNIFEIGNEGVSAHGAHYL